MPSKFLSQGSKNFFPLQVRIIENLMVVIGSYRADQQIPVGSVILEVNGCPPAGSSTTVLQPTDLAPGIPRGYENGRGDGQDVQLLRPAGRTSTSRSRSDSSPAAKRIGDPSVRPNKVLNPSAIITIIPYRSGTSIS